MARASTAAPSPPRRRRVLPAVVVAAVLGAVGATVAIDVVAVQTSSRSLVYPYRTYARHLRTTDWLQTSVVVTAAVVAGVGLVLLLMAFVPGRRKLLAMVTSVDDEWAGVPARSVQRTLAGAALGVDGVSRADAALGRNRADVTVHTPLRDPGDLAGAVRSAVTVRLDQLQLVRPLTVRVQVRRPAPDKETGATLPPSGPPPARDTAADPTPSVPVPAEERGLSPQGASR